MLRPGNAGANTAVDHIDVFETAIDQLDGINPARVLVRADSAGSTHAFLGYLGETGVGFSVGARLDDQARAAIRIAHSPADVWVPAVRQDGQVRDGAHVTEITGHVDVRHVQFTVDAGVQVFFCDPKSPWQLGSK